jgi:hypothetical protein
MKKMITGLMVACGLCSDAASSDASKAPRAMPKIANLTGKACDGIASILWRNKGGLLVGATATAIITKPEAFLGTATSLASQTVTSNGGSILSVVLVVGLIYAGWRYLSRFIGKRWRILPLLLVGLLLFGGGTAMAGTVDYIPASDFECIKPAWNVFTTIILFVIAIFL